MDSNKISYRNIVRNNSPETCIDIFLTHVNNKKKAFDIYKKNAIYSVHYSEKKYANNVDEFNEKVFKNIQRAFAYSN